MIYNIKMSCGHSVEKDIESTGKHLETDINYYARQGLCAACWAMLRERKKAAKKDEETERKGGKDD